MTSVAPAAPFVGPSRAEVLKRLRSRNAADRLPITLGQMEPQAVIRLEDGHWVLRRLERDPARAREIEDRQRAQGDLMPEHFFGALVPGRVLLQSPDRRSFLAGLEALEWTFGP